MAEDQANIVIPSAISGPPPLKKKKKRSLPGTPDPEAEVIALSPATLLATNRYVCEMCGKGFQREQNLQLHRRGHNLPWKLRQRAEPAVRRKRVYVCPERSCVHHHPSRALGDLTGIKKHFSRKHGHEKQWRCHKCSKRYAVQSDCKAHAKTCGTREYRCHCGTFFARKDSFTTHKAFCDVLALETARAAASNTSSLTSFCNFSESLTTANMELQTYTSILKPSNGSEADVQGSSSAFVSYSNGEPSGHRLSWMQCHDLLARTVPSLFSNQLHQHQEIVIPHEMPAAAAGLLQKGASNSASFEIQSGSNGAMERSRAVDEIVRGEELTRDFLGVDDAPAICASSLNGWTRVGI
ncbi:protein indeterminate-domain 12-like [Curcuma longa]|uniref:protein indeterminate-domain 12-like n=1 Tax=Curcuma longa TaxID=136217 RepID=UPI003D9E41AF